jgi:hypothetical protein
MTSVRYYVVPQNGTWLVKLEDGEYGPYRNQADATNFAIDSARKLGDCGEPCEVFVLQRGELRVVCKFPAANENGGDSPYAV